MPALSAAPPGRHLRDHRSDGGAAGEGRVAADVPHRRSEQAVGGAAVVVELVGDALDEVRRDREADADVAGGVGAVVPPAEAIATLMPITLPSESSERAAGVARVDRRIRLDDGERDRRLGGGRG